MCDPSDATVIVPVVESTARYQNSLQADKRRHANCRRTENSDVLHEGNMSGRVRRRQVIEKLDDVTYQP